MNMKVEHVSTAQVLKKLEMLGSKNERVKLLHNDKEDLKKNQMETLLKKREVIGESSNLKDSPEKQDQDDPSAPKKQLKCDDIEPNQTTENKRF